jgi:biotin/methionine sulfoxide reductase
MTMLEQRFPQLAHWGAYTAVVQDGRLVRCETFARDRHPSPMLDAIPEMVYSPLRIARPAVREGWLKKRQRAGRGAERFVEVDWDQALSLAAEELARVRREHGTASIFGGSYGWSSAGRFHHARTQLRRFLYAGGGCTDQVGNYSWGCAQFFLPHVLGSYESADGKVTDWPNLIRHTKLFIAFGGMALKNGQVGSGGIGEHTMLQWIEQAKQAGMEFVVVSPTRADCPAVLGAQWIAIRPNTDTAMMLAMAHVLATETRHDRQFLDLYCTGWEKVEAYLVGRSDGTPKTPEWASAICGVPADTIRDLARRLSVTRTFLTAAWSLQRAHHGEQPYWALITLAAMLGQIGLPGGGFGFGFGSIGAIGNPRGAGSPAMPLGTNNGPKIPVARVADMLLSPNAEYDFDGKRHIYPDVRLVYWAGGNPFHHHQDLNRLRLAWSRPETVIVNDTWWTATARRADIVLPATTTLERNDVGAGARDRFIFAMHKAIDPVGGSRHDFDIFRELAARLGYEAAFTESRGEMAWLRTIYERARDAHARAGSALPPFDAFWQAGYVEQQPAKQDFVLFADFRANPKAHPLKTPSGRIELYSERIASFGYADCPPHATWIPPREWLGADAARRFPLHLVTIQPPARLHGQMDPGPVSRRTKIAGRERVSMNPTDAAARGLAGGDVVRIFNERGECLAGLQIDTGTVPGVIVMATGAWYDPADDSSRPLERHGNPNVLAFDAGTSRLAQGPSALSVLVQVEKWTAKAPAVRAFDPPELTSSAHVTA